MLDDPVLPYLLLAVNQFMLKLTTEISSQYFECKEKKNSIRCDSSVNWVANAHKGLKWMEQFWNRATSLFLFCFCFLLLASDIIKPRVLFCPCQFVWEFVLCFKPGFHIIAPIAPMAPIARNSVQAIRAIHCFHMIARKFYSIVPIARIEQSSIWAITIVPIAPIVPQLSVTVSI